MCRALIIDDDVSIQNMLRTVLQKNKYHVETTACLKEAIELVADFHPDLVFLDLKLQDGEYGGSLLQDTLVGCAVIVMTGKSTTEAEELTLITDGACGIVHKPFHIQRVVAVANSLRTLIAGTDITPVLDALTKVTGHMKTAREQLRAIN